MPKILIIKLTLLLTVIATNVNAESYSVIVESSFEPDSVTGIMLDKSEIHEISIEGVKILDNSKYQIDFDGPSKKEDALVSFNLSNETGNSFITPFVSINIKKNFSTLTATLKKCPDYQPPESIFNNASVVDRLVELRSERLNNRQTEFERLLESGLLDKIKKIELGMGLKYQEEFHAELPRAEIAKRLATIRSLLISYKIQQAN